MKHCESHHDTDEKHKSSVYFANPTGIENILARVTGGHSSSIMGQLGVQGGNANLFLLNPNGIIFGSNASLDVKGSFVATTANGIRLANGDVFGANPSWALPNQILNVHPEALLFNQIAAQPKNSIAVTYGQGNAGNVIVTARDTVSFDGVNQNGNISGAFSQVQSTGVGNGGNVTITTWSLSLTNGAYVIANTFGEGNAGNVRITARDRVAFDGVGNGYSSGAFSQVQSTKGGNGGNVTITTWSLSLTNGAYVGASTYGKGNAGNVRITARDRVAFDGVGSNGSSGAFSTVDEAAVGNGGEVNITTGSLSLTNGAEVIASTFGKGNAGNVRITARDTVAFDGVDSNGNPSGAYSTVASTGVGNGGDINVTTTNLNLTNGAVINARSEGTGNAGNININASQNIRANQGTITATAQRAGGGNITIRANDIRLRNSSPILTSVFDAQGNGGNIAINSKVFLALEDSDILANAVRGNGGNITINSIAFLADLFSTGKAAAVGRNPGDFSQVRGNGRVDISASSAVGISGNINIPDFTFLQNSLSALPANLIDTNKLLANSCIESRRRQTRGRFIVTGNGGLAPRPGDQMHSDYPTGSVSALPSKEIEESGNRNSPQTANWKLGDPVEEAQELALTPDGRIIASSKAELAAIAQAKKSGCPYLSVH